MDILTTKGQATLKDEQRAADIFKKHFPTYQYLETPKDMPAVVDALLYERELMAVVETKCRYDMDYDKFCHAYNCEWLVTFDKINKGAKLAASLGVCLVGFLYIVPSDYLLVQKLSDTDGNFIVDIHLRETETQRTINGGLITRTNAFINMKGARVLNG